MSTLTVLTPIGHLRFCQEQERIVSVTRVVGKESGLEQPTLLLLEAVRQTEAYFCGKRTAFDLPLCIRGTQFEQAVYQTLLEIPYGQTRTYGQLAQMLGRPGAARAVGRACARNPLLVLVPCHRVIGADGKLTGFAAGTEAKRTLLSLEKRNSQR